MKISKLFHWLYACLMLLPVFAIGVTCAYAVFNKNAKDSYSGSESFTYYEKVQYQTNDLIYYQDNNNYLINGFVSGNYYQLNVRYDFQTQVSSEISNSASVVFRGNDKGTDWIRFNDVFYEIDIDTLFFNSSDTFINKDFDYIENINYKVYVDTDFLNLYYLYLDDENDEEFYFKGYINYGANINFEINYLFQIIDSTDIVFFDTSHYSDNNVTITSVDSDIFYKYEEKTTEVSTLDNVFYDSVKEVGENPYFAWANESFLAQPVLYITTLFGMPSDSSIITLLSYWLAISIIYLCFDLIMYVPLLAHRWLDKGMLE